MNSIKVVLNLEDVNQGDNIKGYNIMIWGWQVFVIVRIVGLVRVVVIVYQNVQLVLIFFYQVINIGDLGLVIGMMFVVIVIVVFVVVIVVFIVVVVVVFSGVVRIVCYKGLFFFYYKRFDIKLCNVLGKLIYVFY